MEFRPFVNKYKAQTRVGNWNEDIFLADEISAEFDRLKQSGQLKHQKTEKIMNEFCTEVQTSPHGDKGVCLGDIVMLKNLSLGTTLSVFSDNKKDYIVTAQTRVGNWNEDIFLADEISAEFDRLKQSGQLKHQKTEKIMNEFCTEVQTSPHGDKGVCLGDIVMLKNLSLGTTLSVFSDNKKDYIVTVAKEDRALTRNTFKVVPYIAELTDSDIGRQVRFTQVFCLQSVVNPEFYLASDPIKKLNSLSNIPYGRNALFLTKTKDRLTGWSCVTWDPEERLETELEVIPQNMSLIVNHQASGQALCADPTMTKWNPFGREYDVCCSTRLTPHKAHSQLNCFSLSVIP